MPACGAGLLGRGGRATGKRVVWITTRGVSVRSSAAGAVAVAVGGRRRVQDRCAVQRVYLPEKWFIKFMDIDIPQRYRMRTCLVPFII